jgi:adenylate kinase
MIVSITGTPGTGKTTITGILEKKGFSVIDLKKIAYENNFVIGIDKVRNSKIIDIEKLDIFIGKTYQLEELVFVEGHISHLLKNVDKVILFRLHPLNIKKILKKRGWNNEKVRENVEAEILDIILCEAVEIHTESNCFEINVTDLSVEDVVKCVLELVEKKFNNIKKYKIGEIDWSEVILKDI